MGAIVAVNTNSKHLSSTIVQQVPTPQLYSDLFRLSIYKIAVFL